MALYLLLWKDTINQCIIDFNAELSLYSNVLSLKHCFYWSLYILPSFCLKAPVFQFFNTTSQFCSTQLGLGEKLAIILFNCLNTGKCLSVAGEIRLDMVLWAYAYTFCAFPKDWNIGEPRAVWSLLKSLRQVTKLQLILWIWETEFCFLSLLSW